MDENDIVEWLWLLSNQLTNKELTNNNGVLENQTTEKRKPTRNKEVIWKRYL